MLERSFIHIPPQSLSMNTLGTVEPLQIPSYQATGQSSTLSRKSLNNTIFGLSATQYTLCQKSLCAVSNGSGGSALGGLNCLVQKNGETATVELHEIMGIKESPASKDLRSPSSPCTGWVRGHSCDPGESGSLASRASCWGYKLYELGQGSMLSKISFVLEGGRAWQFSPMSGGQIK